MKKTQVNKAQLQLKKDKIASLTNEQMIGINGGTMPQVTPILLLTVDYAIIITVIEIYRHGLK